MINRGLIILGSVFVILVSCDKAEPLAPSDYIKWVENPANGLCIKKHLKEFVFELQYRPYKYIIALEEKTNRLKRSVINKRIRQLDGYQYYTLKIQSQSGEDILNAGANDYSYEDRLNYCTSIIINDLFLIQDADTIAPSICHFERNYGLASYNKFVIAFKTQPDVSDKEVYFFDQVFSRQAIRFGIKKEDIEQTPELKTIK